MKHAMSRRKLAKGDIVELVTKPNGYESRNYPLTVGNRYTITDFEGSNIWTTCDEPGRTVSYWIGSVKKVES